ncbi:MAG: RNA methyltransferase [Synechococcales bacterium]|nr:RNA methyltransferase [Synechococcales bacterium]
MTDLNQPKQIQPLSQVRIVLVEPQGALNVGSVARVMKNMGLHQLVLVNPQCDPVGDEARQMAVHAIDVLRGMVVVRSLPEALQGCQRAVATTGRSHAFQRPIDPPREGIHWLLASLETNGQTGDRALIFGPEDRGLSNAELDVAQRCITIPTSDAYPSLNLAQAAAICCYELHQWSLSWTEAIASTQAPVLAKGNWPSPIEDPGDMARLEEVESFYEQLELVLLKIGYLYPHTAESRMRKFRRLIQRGGLTQNELALLWGILRQVEWATQPPWPVSDSQKLPPR